MDGNNLRMPFHMTFSKWYTITLCMFFIYLLYSKPKLIPNGFLIPLVTVAMYVYDQQIMIHRVKRGET